MAAGGGRLLVIGPAGALATDLRLLTALVDACRASVLQATPATWSALPRADGRPPGRGYLLAGGDVLLAVTWRAVLAAACLRPSG